MGSRHYGEGMDALLAAAAEEGVHLVCPGFQGAKMVQVRCPTHAQSQCMHNLATATAALTRHSSSNDLFWAGAGAG